MSAVIYVGFFAMMIIGAFLFYFGSVVVTSMLTQQQAAYPSSFTGLETVFLEQWWFWIPALFFFGYLLWVTVQSQFNTGRR